MSWAELVAKAVAQLVTERMDAQMNYRFESIEEIYKNLIAGNSICHVAWVPGEYIKLGKKSLVNSRLEKVELCFGTPSDWRPYIKPKLKKKIELREYVYKCTEDDGEYYFDWYEKDSNVPGYAKPTGRARMIEVDDN